MDGQMGCGHTEKGLMERGQMWSNGVKQGQMGSDRPELEKRSNLPNQLFWKLQSSWL